jgi:hypothetical protein
VSQQSDKSSHRAEGNHDDKSRVVRGRPPDLMILYDVNPKRQDQTTKTHTCAGWRAPVLRRALLRRRHLELWDVLLGWWIDWPLTAAASTHTSATGMMRSPSFS